MTYEITFTRGFKEELESIPRRILPALSRQIEWIRKDPFAKNPNARRLQNAPKSFRVRIGDVRSLHRVFTKQLRVLFYHIGPRGSVYQRPASGNTMLTGDENRRVLDEIYGRVAEEASIIIPDEVTVTSSVDDELPISIEHLSWLCEDDLYLLNVPMELWSAILSAGSLENLTSCDIDEDIRWRLLDYWSNPAPTQVEKLYTLAPGQALETIAQQPLANFLIALDPEQKQALQRIKDDGPYLLKGSAGTGKTLVGLYHIRDMILTRAGESLFDEGEARFGVITYTNTLVDASQAVLEAITPVAIHGKILCSTLDKIAYELASRALGRRPNPLGIAGLAAWIADSVVPKLTGTTAELLDRLGPRYLANEIEQVIVGNGLESVDEYVSFERRGRKRGLREPERRDVWVVYEELRALCSARNVQTFEQIRTIARQYLKSNPNYPRFAVLFVDEAQDFSREARRLCLELVRDPKHLVLAADTGQSIYTVPASWRSADVRFNFQRRRPIMLEKSYRTTREIGRAIASLRLDPGDEDDRSSDAVPVFSGPKPRWIEAPLCEHARVITEEVDRIVRRQGSPINPGQVAIIVRDTMSAQRFRSALKERGIAAQVIDKDSGLRLKGEGVHIVTAHSAKGLGFPIVFVPEVHEETYPWLFALEGAKDAQHREQILDAEQRLLYVAMSRASHLLIMLVASDKPSPFVQKLDRNAHWSS